MEFNAESLIRLVEQISGVNNSIATIVTQLNTNLKSIEELKKSSKITDAIAKQAMKNVDDLKKEIKKETLKAKEEEVDKKK